MNLTLFPPPIALRALRAILAAFPPGNDRWTSPLQRSPILVLLFRPAGRPNTFGAGDLDATVEALAAVGWAEKCDRRIRFKMPTQLESCELRSKFMKEVQREMRLVAGALVDRDRAASVLGGEREMETLILISQLVGDSKQFDVVMNDRPTISGFATCQSPAQLMSKKIESNNMKNKSETREARLAAAIAEAVREALSQDQNHQPETAPAVPGFVTKSDIAKLICKSTRTVELWAAKGWIPSILIGRSRLYDRDAVRKALIERFGVGMQIPDH